MKVITPEQIPVIPPPPWLAASEKQFKESEEGLRPLVMRQVGSAEQAWKNHKAENGYKPNVLAFGPAEGPADKLRPYAEALRRKRELK